MILLHDLFFLKNECEIASGTQRTERKDGWIIPSVLELYWEELPLESPEALLSSETVPPFASASEGRKDSNFPLETT